MKNRESTFQSCADIRELAPAAVKDTDAFYARLSGEMEKRYAQDGLELQKEYDRLVERSREIDEIFLNLYADKAKGIITEQRFLKLTEGLETEQEQNNSRMRELAEMLHAADEKENLSRKKKVDRRYFCFRSQIFHAFL